MITTPGGRPSTRVRHSVRGMDEQRERDFGGPLPVPAAGASRHGPSWWNPAEGARRRLLWPTTLGLTEREREARSPPRRT
ncbi:hypothetical protein [Streptomyces alboniger]|uniref:hypothetical protein n=1 Tax=Streptomyces alboniger TaxID=132473 RepID=UPI00142EDC68|nr:hypothetical protein [Streptomyces alboniger]